MCRAGKCTDVLRRQLYDAGLAVHAHDPALCRCKLFGTGCSSFGFCGRLSGAGAVGPGALRGRLSLCGIGGGSRGACSCFLGGSGSAAGAFQHAGHELLIQRGRQLLRAAVRGQDGVGVVAAGAGVGGIACVVDGGQHPLAAGAAGEPPVHRYPVAFFQRNGSKQGAVAAAQVQRHGASGPLFRQGKVQLVHAGSVLRTEVQAVGAGVKFGAAALPANDLDLHTKPSFLLFSRV